jgi:hypothetical protein
MRIQPKGDLTMYQVVFQEQESMELGIDGKLDRKQYDQMIHQLESLITTFGRINVLLDLTNLEDYDKSLAIDDVKFYREHKDSLGRVAVVAGDTVARFFTALFEKFTETEVRHFQAEELEQARSWIFRSNLP